MKKIFVHGDPNPDPPKPLTEESVRSMVAELLGGFKSEFSKTLDDLRAKPPETPVKKDAPGSTPEENAQIAELRRQVASLTNGFKDSEAKRTAAEEKALKTEQESAVRSALSGFQFVDAEARADAERILNGLVSRDEAGNLIAGDNLPVEDFARDYFPSKKSYLLAPDEKSGAGVAPGGGAARGVGKGVPTIEMIKPDMSADDLRAVAIRIRDLAAQSR